MVNKICLVRIVAHTFQIKESITEINVKETENSYIFTEKKIAKRIPKAKLMVIDTNLLENHNSISYHMYCLCDEESINKALELLRNKVISKIYGYKSDIDSLIQGIEFDKKFDTKYKNLYDKSKVKVKFNTIISSLFHLCLSSFSFEMLEDGVFMTLKKGSYTIYIQYYFDDVNDEKSILSMFNDSEKLPSHQGSVEEIIKIVFSNIKTNLNNFI